MRTLCLPMFVLWLGVAGAGAAPAQQTSSAPPPAADRTRAIAADRDLRDLALVRSTAGTAVVRFGKGSLLVVKLHDRVARERAEVTAIDAGRMVVVDRSVDASGR